MARLPPPTSTIPYPNDLSGSHMISGSVTPTRVDTRNAGAKRRQTLLSLLDALTELKLEDDRGAFGTVQQSNVERESDGPAADEHVQVLGAETFTKFQRRINSLDRELRNFANATRQLGSSVGIISSTYHLRERVAQVLFLFRENAADLFPRKVSRQPKETVVVPNRIHTRKQGRFRHPPHVSRPMVSESVDPEDFPFQMEMFAKDVMIFLKSLNEFPEFTDEAVNHSISSFEADLKYWASCLKTYEGQFRYPSVQRYLHDLTSEMGEHLDTITSSLSMFLEVGIPTIRFAQKHAASNLLNLTTVATFFSAVTATTLQFSFDQKETPSQVAVNAFWFCSLVFSIASAVNSLLGLTWKQAMYRSPGHRVPWWVLIWIKRSPLVFLVISVAAFSIGLCVFTYASEQSPVTSALTTIFTAFSSFGLAAVSAWFVFERWTFNRHRGRKWLMDVLADVRSEVYKIPPISWLVRIPPKHVKRAATWGSGHIRRAGTSLTRVGTFIGGGKSLSEKDGDIECTLPVASPLGPSSPMSPMASPLGKTSQLPYGQSSASLSAMPYENEQAVPKPPTLHGRFASAVRSVMLLQSASPAVAPLTISPRKKRTLSSSLSTESGSNREAAEPVASLRVSRVAALIPVLKSLEPTQDLTPHQALVRHLQFSPNGKFLATCSWDRTCVVFRVGEPFTVHRVLAHPSGFVGQVAWSPTGNLLLAKMNRGIKVWTTESGVCKKTIDRRRAVQSITWFPDGEAFMSVEDSVVTKLDVNGNVLDCYQFDRMKLHDVAVMIATNGSTPIPNSQRLLCVATLLSSADGLQPSKSRAEKQIIVYNLDKKEIENQVPVLHEVRDITLARNGHVALVSYENKAPPQLWKIEMVKDRNNESSVSARLSLIHTYMPKTPVAFAGPSYFGGKDDQLVLCAGKAGDIHIWDRESGALLHYFRAQDLDGDLTCIAWNHAAVPFMFSTGSHDGTVRIWTSPNSPNASATPQREPLEPKRLDLLRTETSLGFPFGVMNRSDSPTAQNEDETWDQRTRRTTSDERDDTLLG